MTERPWPAWAPYVFGLAPLKVFGFRGVAFAYTSTLIGYAAGFGVCFYLV